MPTPTALNLANLRFATDILFPYRRTVTVTTGATYTLTDDDNDIILELQGNNIVRAPTTLSAYFQTVDVIETSTNPSTFTGACTNATGQLNTAGVPGSRYHLHRILSGEVMVEMSGWVAPTLYEIKIGLMATMPTGWVALQGQAISTLSATQQSNCVALGWTTNLPDARDAVMVSSATEALGAVLGSNSRTIARTNLPNFSMSATTSSDTHNHIIALGGGTENSSNTFARGGNFWGGASPDTTTSSDAHTHTVSVSTGGGGQALDIRQKRLIVNTWIYLGR